MSGRVETRRTTYSAPAFAPAFWAVEEGALFDALGTSDAGLSTVDAMSRIVPGDAIGTRVNTDLELIVRQFRSPIVLLLLVAATLSAILEGVLDATIIGLIVAVSAVLGWFQERGAVRAIDALAGSVQVHADVVRDGCEAQVPIDAVVPGDVVVLRVGDLVPGDARVVSSASLTMDESVLTGESHPRSKRPGRVAADVALTARWNVVHMGTHVVGGEGRAVVVAVGRQSEFGRLATQVARTHVPTSFERGVARYGLMLAEATGVLVLGVFVANIALGRPLLESLLFSLALAVGLTPQMLPAIVTVSLAVGARLLAARRVVVKRLDAIEDTGAIDVLCIDKTGTLTEGEVRLVGAFAADGGPSDRVLRLAHWNASLQTGFTNPIDAAVVASVGETFSTPRRLAEIPFDFHRRMLSVVVETDDGRLLVTKGAFEEVAARCSTVAGPTGEVAPGVAVTAREDVLRRLSAGGLRVLAVATRRLAAGEVVSGPAAEVDMRFEGFVAFHDPVKAGAVDAVSELRDLGVAVVLITGDNRVAAAATATVVGIGDGSVVTPGDLAGIDDVSLAADVMVVGVVAEADPSLKERIVASLSRSGRTVAFIGDGVNDAAALHAADVGVSVESGVDVAKQAADLVLLDKDLSVVADGIRLGRRVFANTSTYVRVTTSANFGNMVSLALATVFLPYLPMLPLQILLLNFLSDVPGMTIAADRVDGERLLAPGRWDVARVRRFMVVFGLVSTSVDLATFWVLVAGFGADSTGLRTGWFVTSLLTEVAALLVLRTGRPAWRSSPARPLLWSSAAVAGVALLVPFLPWPAVIGFGGVGAREMLVLVALALGYVVLTETMKRLRPDLLA